MIWNRLQVAGYLADKPVLRILPSGKPIATARLAETYRFTDHAGEPREQTTWFPLEFKDRFAESVCDDFNKGDHVFVEGAMRQRTWKDDAGKERSTWELTVFHIHALPARRNSRLNEDARSADAEEEGDDRAKWPV